jgi:hypothetical protein
MVTVILKVAEMTLLKYPTLRGILPENNTGTNTKIDEFYTKTTQI